MEFLQKYLSSKEFWLPENITWDDLTEGRNLFYYPFAKNDSIFMPFVLVVAILLLRSVMSELLFKPAIRRRVKRVTVDNSLSSVRASRYRKKNQGKTKNRMILNFSAVQEIQRILSDVTASTQTVEHLAHTMSKRHDLDLKLVRKLLTKTAISEMQTSNKVCEACWYTFAHTLMFVYGLWCLSDKTFVWNLKECWLNYPMHPVTSEIYWYYMGATGFYWSMMIFQFKDTKRKDFWQMIVHHVATLALLQFSWSLCFTRVGVLVLLVHDSADIFLQASKIANYLKFEAASEALFILFLSSWVISRLYIYPVYILHSTAVHSLEIFGSYPVANAFKFFLYLLFVLHIFWTFLILKLLLVVWKGGEGKDTRSADNSDEENEEDSLEGKSEKCPENVQKEEEKLEESFERNVSSYSPHLFNA